MDQRRAETSGMDCTLAQDGNVTFLQMSNSDLLPPDVQLSKKGLEDMSAYEYLEYFDLNYSLFFLPQRMSHPL